MNGRGHQFYSKLIVTTESTHVVRNIQSKVRLVNGLNSLQTSNDLQVKVQDVVTHAA